jgi:uncharacterized protein YbjT (DUF2867 family)
MELLLQDPEYECVLALVRHPLALKNPKLQQHVIDFDQLDDLELPENTDIFCALGTTIRKAGSRPAFRKVDFEYPKKLAFRGAAFQARQFLLVSSVGANPAADNFYLSVKGETEKAVSALPFQAVHIFRPSILVGDRSESRPAEKIGIALARAFEFAMVGGYRKYRPMPVDVLAAAMLSAARHARAGKHIYHYDEIVALPSE